MNDLRLSDCIVERIKFARLNDNEFDVLCGMLFPYSNRTIPNAPEAKLIIDDPNSYIMELENNDEILAQILEAFSSQKYFDGNTYYREEDVALVEIFAYMNDVCPNVYDHFFANISYVRESLINDLNQKVKAEIEEISYNVSEYYQSNKEKVDSKYDKYIEFLVDVKKKVVDSETLSYKELISLKNKKYLEFVS